MTSATRTWATLKRRNGLTYALAVVITLYGGLLRLDAFTGKYGTLSHPRWARVMTRDVAPIAASLRPSSVHWGPELHPYVGGDPITYIQYGRSMATFYQAHVREPVFLAMTSAGLWALDDQDVGVSLASAAGSTLAIFATFLVGAELLSPWAGIIAALFVATEFELITWGVDGWRDDTFTAAILFSMWSLLRLRNRPSFGNAVAAGVFGRDRLPDPHHRDHVPGAGAGVAGDRPRGSVRAASVSPRFGHGCGRDSRDHRGAILDQLHAGHRQSAHRHRLPHALLSVRREPADRQADERRGVHPAEIRGAAGGDTRHRAQRDLVQPFFTKWNGFGPWAPGAGAVARALGAAGLAAMPFFAAGRLLLVALLGSLVPYMFTWNVGGGGEWRFTMHAYPFFFVAVGVAVVGLVRAVRAVAADPVILRSRALGIAWRAALAATSPRSASPSISCCRGT